MRKVLIFSLISSIFALSLFFVTGNQHNSTASSARLFLQDLGEGECESNSTSLIESSNGGQIFGYKITKYSATRCGIKNTFFEILGTGNSGNLIILPSTREESTIDLINQENKMDQSRIKYALQNGFSVYFVDYFTADPITGIHQWDSRAFFEDESRWSPSGRIISDIKWAKSVIGESNCTAGAGWSLGGHMGIFVSALYPIFDVFVPINSFAPLSSEPNLARWVGANGFNYFTQEKAKEFDEGNLVFKWDFFPLMFENSNTTFIIFHGKNDEEFDYKEVENSYNELSFEQKENISFIPTNDTHRPSPDTWVQAIDFAKDECAKLRRDKQNWRNNSDNGIEG
jgi:hypothetical protein